MGEQELYEVFLNCLLAESAKMEPHYFQVPVYESDKLFLRERVYCYELYHLLRLGLGNCYSCKLMGELDKTSSPIIQPIAGGKEPDFVWHQPGTEKNIAIVEVKALSRFPNGQIIMPRITADTTKLRDFLHPNIHYRKAIQLLYGPGSNEEVTAIYRNMMEAAGDLAGQFVVLWHPQSGSRAQIVA